MLSEKKAVNALKPWWDVAFQVTITALIVLGKEKLNLTYYCLKLKILNKVLNSTYLSSLTFFMGSLDVSHKL